MTLRVQRVSGSGKQEATAFAATLNARPEHHIGFLDADPVTAAIEMTEQRVLDNAAVARHRGRIVGYLGLQLSDEDGRIWVHGPLVDHASWDEVSDALWSELRAALEAAPLVDMYFDVANARCDAFARRHGFLHHKDTFVLFAPVEAPASAEPGVVTRFETHHGDDVIELHEATFPNTWISGRKMTSETGTDKPLWVAVAPGGGVAGYLYAEAHPSTGEGAIDFVSVTRDHRRQGYGERLVRTAMRWMHERADVAHTYLTVDEGNAGARRLYEKLGWSHELTLRAMRLSHSS